MKSIPYVWLAQHKNLQHFLTYFVIYYNFTQHFDYAYFFQIPDDKLNDCYYGGFFYISKIPTIVFNSVQLHFMASFFNNLVNQQQTNFF
jgi:hypothetical protein